jgi:hypothetical protein
MLPLRVTMLPLALWRTDDTSPQMAEQGWNAQQWSNRRTGRLLMRKRAQQTATVAIVSAAMTTEINGESPSA